MLENMSFNHFLPVLFLLQSGFDSLYRRVSVILKETDYVWKYTERIRIIHVNRDT